jgi:ankyrin repeat protein
VQNLIMYRVNVNQADKNGIFPLERASAQRNSKMVELLLKAGAFVEKNLALHWAAYANCVESVSAIHCILPSSFTTLYLCLLVLRLQDKTFG